MFDLHYCLIGNYTQYPSNTYMGKRNNQQSGRLKKQINVASTCLKSEKIAILRRIAKVLGRLSYLPGPSLDRQYSAPRRSMEKRKISLR